ncbi:MAG: ATPase [Prolixibacteraceae bacterium]|jgi:periplasmic mercuric ion binding protein|nr:ATPase [Prolixibacteraceae bacterium]MBT6045195.1 ATPase [Candidatus Scalindua sp.]MBT6765931.1 ATPase [Prolixibacteraceae bacterium]
MKTKVLSLVALFVMGIFTVFAGNKTEKINVKGNCGMCETRIEKAALSVDGVSKAAWDKKTKKLEVVFDDAKTNVDKVEVALAKVGHDTKNHKASAEVYDKLPGCCKYDRE